MIPEVCTRSAAVGDAVGGSCPTCGHATLLHPGPHNPALKSCPLCELVALLAKNGAES